MPLASPNCRIRFKQQFPPQNPWKSFELQCETPVEFGQMQVAGDYHLRCRDETGKDGVRLVNYSSIKASNYV